MKSVCAGLVMMWLGLSSALGLQLPWEKEGAKKSGPADAPAAPEITAVEFVYRLAMDELHERVGGSLRVGSPKISPKEIRVHIAVTGEGEADLVFVEKENDGQTAVVVVGPPESEGDVYHLVRKGNAWAKQDIGGSMAEDGRQTVDPKIAEVANAFFDALKAGDVPKAYALASPMYRERVDEKGFRAFLGRWPALREHGIAGVVGARDHRGVGLAEVELHVTERLIHKAHLEFDDVDGKWRVGLIEISGADGDAPAKSEQSPAAFIGDAPPSPDAAAEAAAKKIMALPEIAELARRLKAEPQRFGEPAARVEEVPSEEQEKNYGFRFHGVAVGYDDGELARFMIWQRFGVDAATGEIRAYHVAEDKYVSVVDWRAGRKGE